MATAVTTEVCFLALVSRADEAVGLMAVAGTAVIAGIWLMRTEPSGEADCPSPSPG